MMRSEEKDLNNLNWSRHGYLALLVCTSVIGILLLASSAIGDGGQSSHGFCRQASASEIRKETLKMELKPDGWQRRQDGASVVLVVNTRTVGVGKTIFARLLNLGRHVAYYGREFVIESLSEGKWASDPASPSGPWPRIRSSLPSDSASRCYRFAVPTDQALGRYRFATRVELNFGAEQAVRRAAEFTVTNRR